MRSRVAPAPATGKAQVTTPGTWAPPVDIFQNGNQEVVLKAELPDMNREDIEITVEDGTLAITVEGVDRASSEQRETTAKQLTHKHHSQAA